MDHGSIFKIIVLLQEILQLGQLHWSVVIRYEGHRLPAVNLNEISKSLAENPIVYYQHSVAWFRKRSTGRFKAQNSFSPKYERLVICVYRFGKKPAGFPVKIEKSRVKIRVCALQTSCHSNVFSDLSRPCCHNTVHCNSS